MLLKHRSLRVTSEDSVINRNYWTFLHADMDIFTIQWTNVEYTPVNPGLTRKFTHILSPPQNILFIYTIRFEIFGTKVESR